MREINVTVDHDAAVFSSEGRILGRYVVSDPFKPHFSSLNTYQGLAMTHVSPADHKHHKGMMYALRCEDLNFWEEEPSTGDCGYQHVTSTTLTEHGIRQTILWTSRDDTLRTYDETRTISCAVVDDHSHAPVVHWTFVTERIALRDHTLVQSPWSAVNSRQQKVNYHGLGVRLPWSWSFPKERQSQIAIGDDASSLAPCEPDAAMGSTGKVLKWTGKMDGHWEPRYASVIVSQEQSFGWFTLATPFAYLAVGPSQITTTKVSNGTECREVYRVSLADEEEL